MNGRPPIPITFSGGMNNVDTALDLFLRKKGEVPFLVNADTTLKGRLKLLRPLTALNSVAASASIHTIYRGKGSDVILIGYSTIMGHLLNGITPTSLLTGLASASKSIGHAGNWVFMGDGTCNRSIYLAGPTGCSWGQAIPSAAPTVAVGAAGSVKDGTYSCYYRYKITLPDGVTVLRTGLSPAGSVAITGADADKKINWSALVHSTFTGVTGSNLQVELFRTKTGWSATYLVATVDSPTTSLTDEDVSDADAVLNTEFAETDYYPPPDNIDIVTYHPGADRMFVAVDNNVYWSEAGLYHIFQYSTSASEYTNVNSVFLSGENVTSMIILDEQLFIGCQRTWRRLRGSNPTYWQWEDVAGATKGPINWQSVAVTPWGAIYPGNDGYLWLFNSFSTNKLLEYFQFDTDPDTTCRAAFDGRFYRLFYGDATYPELVLDFLEYPSRPPRIVKSTRNATACHYDPAASVFYMGDSDGYVRSGEDTSQDVTLTVRTPEIPVEQLVKLGDMASLLIHADTGGDNLDITPYQDEVAQTALTSVATSSLVRQALPLPLDLERTISLGITITSSEDVELREPWMLSREDDG